MERADKRALKRRLHYIYIGYFVILALGFMHSMVPSITRSLHEGVSQFVAHEESVDRNSSEWWLVAVMPRLFESQTLAIEPIEGQAPLQLEPYEGFVSVWVDRATLPQEIYRAANRCYEGTFLLDLVTIASWVAVLVLIALIIRSLRSSLRDEHPLPQRNILYMRLIGGLVIFQELCQGVIFTLGHRIVELLSGLERGSYGEFFPIDYGMLLLGLLILFSAEIFALGSRLQEEQRLTI